MISLRKRRKKAKIKRNKIAKSKYENMNGKTSQKKVNFFSWLDFVKNII